MATTREQVQQMFHLVWEKYPNANQETERAAFMEGWSLCMLQPSLFNSVKIGPDASNPNCRRIHVDGAQWCKVYGFNSGMYVMDNFRPRLKYDT